MGGNIFIYSISLHKGLSSRSSDLIENLTFVLMFFMCLLNLLNELGKRDKMRGLPSILFLYRNEFDKFNNTRARKLDSVLSYDIYITLKSHICRKNVYFCHYVRNVVMDVITFPENL